MTFKEILEAVEEMSVEAHGKLIDKLKRRHIARRREQLAQEIASARRQYRAGKCKAATPAEIMREVLS